MDTEKAKKIIEQIFSLVGTPADSIEYSLNEKRGHVFTVKSAEFEKISADRDEEDAELHVKPEEIIQPNIIKNKSVNMAFTKIVTVHDLISKFLQNIEYSKELDKIEKNLGYWGMKWIRRCVGLDK